MSEDPERRNFVALTVDVVSAYVSNNSIPAAELPNVLETVYVALTQGAQQDDQHSEFPKPPPMPIKRSITPDYLVSFEDGRQYRVLKRHLGTYGLTPDQYRQKWGLPQDYPMVAPSYAKARSDFAKSMGLGQVRKQKPASLIRAVAKGATSSKAERSRKLT